jgi:hypothetical protein
VRASANAWRVHAVDRVGVHLDRLRRRRDLGADVAGEVVGERQVEQAVDARAEAARALERRGARRALHEPQRSRAADRSHASDVCRRARGRAVRGLGRKGRALSCPS